MIELPLSFKFRHNQREMVRQILNRLGENDDVGLIAPTDYGKMVVACIVALSQRLPVTYVTSTYQSIPEVIETLRMLGKKKRLAITVPMGRAMIRRSHCKIESCKGCEKQKVAIPLLKKEDFIGKVVDVEWVIKNTDCCAYEFLQNISKIADWVITHYANIPNPTGRGGRLERTGFLVSDEIDKALEPRDMLVVSYTISRKGFHLETSSEQLPMIKAMGIMEKLKEDSNPYEKGHPDHEYELLERWATYFQKQLKWLLDLVYKNPIILEMERIDEVVGKEVSDDVIEKDLVKYALMTASEKLKSYVKIINLMIKTKVFEVFNETLENFNKDMLRKLKPEDRGLIEDLIYILKFNKQLYFKRVNYSPRRNEGYIEIWMVTGKSNFQQRVEHFDKRLYISATFPSNIGKDIAIVKTDIDINAQDFFSHATREHLSYCQR